MSEALVKTAVGLAALSGAVLIYKGSGGGQKRPSQKKRRKRRRDACCKKEKKYVSPVSIAHPLDPLTLDETNLVGKYFRDVVIPSWFDGKVPEEALGKYYRVSTITLKEPSKKEVRAFDAETAPHSDYSKFPRRLAKIVVTDCKSNGVVEVVIAFPHGSQDLSQFATEQVIKLPGRQAMITVDEYLATQKLVTANEDFRAAMKARGYEDPRYWIVEPWSCGYMGPDWKNSDTEYDEQKNRILRTQVWVRTPTPADNVTPLPKAGEEDVLTPEKRQKEQSELYGNGYAHPVGGLVTIVDLNSMKVIDLEDSWKTNPIPVPNHKDTVADYHPKIVLKKMQPRTLKPIEITQPEGVNWKVTGNLIEWQNWKFRIGWSAREGLILHRGSVSDPYSDGEHREVFYRMSLVEMVVPYGSPDPQHARKNAFDEGEYGLGALAMPLQKGCNCLGAIRYFDAVNVNSQGVAEQLPGPVCMHEEDCNILWRHCDFRHLMYSKGNHGTEVRRSTRLVLSFIPTVGNYEYGFFWYFYLDGTVELEIKMTGIVNTNGSAPGTTPKYGTKLGEGLVAQIHQHFISCRIDPSVDGEKNSVAEVNAVPEKDSNNPYGNAFYAEETLLKTESQAVRNINVDSGRYWKILNTEKKTRAGNTVAWKLLPGTNAVSFAKDDSYLIKRAPFIKNHLYVTPFRENERFPAGEYPNQARGDDEQNNIGHWIKQNRDIVDKDVVLWYTVGATHFVRQEDFPVMPVAQIGFKLKPCNFFEGNPCLNVTPADTSSRKILTCDDC
eukprot:TRINITY_DN8036_c0_g1_i1.p1 TRINITY_DN8036_c0_g1~~TRINITY_DN8036_c0_g1_i1.p1  ORF type:complete len:788 (+),score=139.37 TRINITY_DN8036_c0_g1_i1:31-2364(+)